MMKQVITKNMRETWKLAEEIAKEVKGGDVLGLVGDLGGGKTTFTKGLAKAFRIAEKDVQSPTFTLIKEYCVKCQVSSVKKLYHLDMYRLHSEKEAQELGLEELFQEKDAIFVIEWANKIKNLLPERTKWIEFGFIDERTRQITVNS